MRGAKHSAKAHARVWTGMERRPHSRSTRDSIGATPAGCSDTGQSTCSCGRCHGTPRPGSRVERTGTTQAACRSGTCCCRRAPHLEHCPGSRSSPGSTGETRQGSGCRSRHIHNLDHHRCKQHPENPAERTGTTPAAATPELNCWMLPALLSAPRDSRSTPGSKPARACPCTALSTHSCVRCHGKRHS